MLRILFPEIKDFRVLIGGFCLKWKAPDMGQVVHKWDIYPISVSPASGRLKSVARCWQLDDNSSFTHVEQESVTGPLPALKSCRSDVSHLDLCTPNNNTNWQVDFLAGFEQTN